MSTLTPILMRPKTSPSSVIVMTKEVRLKLAKIFKLETKTETTLGQKITLCILVMNKHEKNQNFFKQIYFYEITHLGIWQTFSPSANTALSALDQQEKFNLFCL